MKDDNYKCHWNILVFCDQWKMMSDLNMFHEKMSGFVSFSLFRLTLVIKLRNFEFGGLWNTLIFFNKIDMVSDLNVSHWKCLIFLISMVWVHFSHETEKFWFWKPLKYCNVFWSKRYGFRFKYVPLKDVWFCFISILWVQFSHKAEKFWLWRSLKYFTNFWFEKWCQIRLCPVKQCLI